MYSPLAHRRSRTTPTTASSFAAEPPSPSRTMLSAPHRLPGYPSGLHVPRSLFCTKLRSKPSSVAPDHLLRRAHRRGALLRRCSAAAPRPISPKPSDPAWTPAIRIRDEQIWATRLRSNGLDPRIPVRPGSFSNRNLVFSHLSPWNLFLAKILRFSSVFGILYVHAIVVAHKIVLA